MNPRWTDGNRARLLENGEAFFPAVFDAIRGATNEVILETFIVFEDKVGQELHAALLGAAARGVRVDVMVDGFGSADLSAEFVRTLTDAGVRLRAFDPGARRFGRRWNVLRRMHRKIVVVDGARAFVGGINYSADHLGDFGPQAKQDYAVELEGPVVDQIRRFALAAMRGEGETTPRAPVAASTLGGRGVRALFVTRDNGDHQNDIERHYRAAIRSARKRIVIANAYFFPGYGLLRQLRRAARRGVEVHLILQGEPDMPIVKTLAEMLYESLQRAGVHIHEYCKRPLHGKVAVIDDDWSTVGSSNLDPLSLSLNLEANVILRDAAFAGHLAERLQHLIDTECKRVEPRPEPALGWDAWLSVRSFFVFHFIRGFPTWGRWLPQHRPTLAEPLAEVEHSAVPLSAAPVGLSGSAGPSHAPPRLVERSDG